MKFKDYILLESSLEEINSFVPDISDSLVDSVVLLHELEYKTSKIISSPYSINSKLANNVLKRFLKKAIQVYNELSPEMVTSFGKWNTNHPVEDEDSWTDMVFKYYEEHYNEKEAIKAFLEGGAGWGGYILSKEDIIRYIDKDKVKEFAKEDYKQNPELLEWCWEQFLKEVKEIDTIEMGSSDIKNYIEENDLHDEVLEYYMDNIFSAEDYVQNFEAELFVDVDTLKRAIKSEIYPQYMDRWGVAIAEIKENISAAVKRLEQGDNITIDAEHNIDDLSHKEIYEVISKLTVAISLALNVVHVGGNIIQDYFVDGSNDLTGEFIDNLGNYDTSKWDEELGLFTKK